MAHFGIDVVRIEARTLPAAMAVNRCANRANCTTTPACGGTRRHATRYQSPSTCVEKRAGQCSQTGAACRHRGREFSTRHAGKMESGLRVGAPGNSGLIMARRRVSARPDRTRIASVSARSGIQKFQSSTFTNPECIR